MCYRQDYKQVTSAEVLDFPFLPILVIPLANVVQLLLQEDYKDWFATKNQTFSASVAFW
jgi:hypothetical protein